MQQSVARISWDEFLSKLDWQQGEHVSLIGPTGCGKTTLALSLLPRRAYTVAFGSKPRDETLENLVTLGWRKIEEWRPRPDEKRIVLWPKFRKTDAIVKQRQVFVDAFKYIFESGGWCVYIDEAKYFVEMLKLSPYLKLYWFQGRALGISLVATTQRAAYMPLEMYNQATHLFIWRENDRVNLSRIGGIAADPSGGIDSRQVMDIVASLPLHECLYVNTRTGQMFQTKAKVE